MTRLPQLQTELERLIKSGSQDETTRRRILELDKKIRTIVTDDFEGIDEGTQKGLKDFDVGFKKDENYFLKVLGFKENVSVREKIASFLPFILSLIIVYYWGWSVNELSWSLWLCSLAMVLVLPCYWIVKNFKLLFLDKFNLKNTFNSILGVALLLSLYGLFFGGMYFSFGKQLNSWVPLQAECKSTGMYGCFSWIALAPCAWFVPLAVYANFKQIQSPWSLVFLFANIFKMVIVLLILDLFGTQGSFLVYGLIYSLFFFPFSTFYLDIKKAMQESDKIRAVNRTLFFLLNIFVEVIKYVIFISMFILVSCGLLSKF